MQSEIQLCDADCEKFHPRRDVCKRLGISNRTFYRERDAGNLRVTRKGMVYCPNIRAYVEKEWQSPPIDADEGA